jgi:hypothetical protein
MEFDNTKMIELTVSGTIRTEIGTDKGSVPFNGVKMQIPECSEEYYTQHAKRMMWITAREDKALKKISFQGLIQIYVDKAEKCEGTPSCVDKDVKEMEWLDLQLLACCLKVREIPMYLNGSIRNAREKAYETYMKVIKKKKVLKSGKDKKIISEKVHRRFAAELANGDINNADLEFKVQDELDKAFNMVVDPNNRENSYSYANLPPLIAVKSRKATK